MNAYEHITAEIRAALEQGVVPWRKPWVSAGVGHRNPLTGTVYRGNNPIMLELACWAHGFTDPRWITLKQARAAGGRVRDGEFERPTWLSFFKRLATEDKTTGDRKVVPILRAFKVYNVDQVEGIEFPVPPTFDWEPLEAIERTLDGAEGWGGIARRQERPENAASYMPDFDQIALPARTQFERPERFYHAWAHEGAHSTAHPDRLDRWPMKAMHEDRKAYAREELIAEMSAAMILAACGVQPDVGQDAAYVASWLKALDDDKHLVVWAAGRAQKVADYVRGVEPPEFVDAPAEAVAA